MLALGLLPSSNTSKYICAKVLPAPNHKEFTKCNFVTVGTKPRSSHPTVSLERLDPEVEAEVCISAIAA